MNDWIKEIKEPGYYWAYENLEPVDADLFLIKAEIEDGKVSIESFYDTGLPFFDEIDFVIYKKIDKPDYEEIKKMVADERKL